MGKGILHPSSVAWVAIMLADEFKLALRYTNILEPETIKNKLKLDCFTCGIDYLLVCLPNPLLYPFHWSTSLLVNGKSIGKAFISVC